MEKQQSLIKSKDTLLAFSKSQQETVEYTQENTATNLQSLGETASFVIPTLTAIMEETLDNSEWATSVNEAANLDGAVEVMSTINGLNGLGCESAAAAADVESSIAVPAQPPMQLVPLRIANPCLATPRDHSLFVRPLTLAGASKPRAKKPQTCSKCGATAAVCPSMIKIYQ
jgi:hypothetical protein